MAWDASKPADDEIVTTGQAGIRANWTALETTITEDHNGMDATRDGEHKQITLYKLDSKPNADGKTDTGYLYTKDDGTGDIELFYEDAGAVETQITDSGRIKGNIMAAFNFDNSASSGTYTAGVSSEIRYYYNITTIVKTSSTLTVTFSEDLPANYMPIVQQNDGTVLKYTSTPVGSIALKFSTGPTHCMAVFYDADA